MINFANQSIEISNGLMTGKWIFMSCMLVFTVYFLIQNALTKRRIKKIKERISRLQPMLNEMSDDVTATIPRQTPKTDPKVLQAQKERERKIKRDVELMSKFGKSK